MLKKILINFPETNNAKRLSNSATSKEAKPFIQWIGGKREMIPQYNDYLPQNINVYYEPFFGGGAMFFYLKPKKAILSDNNLELIKTYEGVRDYPEKVIELLKMLKSRHSRELFIEIRSLDRKFDLFDLENYEIAARCIYLNQTCFNGVYRVNKKGQFNVPLGSSLNRSICDEEVIRKASKLLRLAIIKCQDFEITISETKKNDFIYFDPPYYPVSRYSDFTRYTKEKFYKEDQIRLKNVVDSLNTRGCKVMISNSDSDFIKELYRGYKIHKVRSNRTLNCKKDKRGAVTELLILNY